MSWYEQPGPAPPGWYPDPGGRGQRWWDGSYWTDHYAPAPQPVAQYGPRPPWQPPAAPPVAAAPPASADSVWPPPEYWVAAVAVIGLLAGSVAPWVTIEANAFGESVTRDVGGVRGDGPGVLPLLAGITAGAFLLVWLFARVRGLAIVAAGLALAAAAVAIEHLGNPGSGAEVPQPLDLRAGWGAWVTLLASLVAAAGAAVLAVRTRTPP